MIVIKHDGTGGLDALIALAAALFGPDCNRVMTPADIVAEALIRITAAERPVGLTVVAVPSEDNVIPIGSSGNVLPLFIDRSAESTGWPSGYAPAIDYSVSIGEPRCTWEHDGTLGPLRFVDANGARVDAWRHALERGEDGP